MIEPLSAAAPVPRPLAEVPGVADVYDPRPPLSRALGAATSALRLDSAPPIDGILVASDGAGSTASAAVSISSSSRTPDVARAVADEVLLQHPTVDRVSVQVRRIA